MNSRVMIFFRLSIFIAISLQVRAFAVDTKGLKIKLEERSDNFHKHFAREEVATAKPADKPADQSSAQPADKPAAQSTAQPAAQPGAQSTSETAGQSLVQSSPQSGAQPASSTSPQASDQSAAQAVNGSTTTGASGAQNAAAASAESKAGRPEDYASQLWDTMMLMSSHLEQITSLGSNSTEIVQGTSKVSDLIPQANTLRGSLLAAVPQKTGALKEATENANKAGEQILNSLKAIQEKAEDANLIKQHYKTLENSFRTMLSASDGIATAAVPKLAANSNAGGKKETEKDEGEAKAAQPQGADQKNDVPTAAQSQGAESKADMSKAGEQKTSDPKAADDQKAAEQKTSEPKAVDEKAGPESKPVEQKPIQQKSGAETQPKQ